MLAVNELLPGFNWLVEGSIWLVILKCWALTPLMMFLVIAPILESRWLSLNWRKQYLSFVPGDFFLGVMVALLVGSLRQTPTSYAWYDNAWIHILVLLMACATAVVLTRGEIKADFYPRRAMLSPTKIYHNGVLYAGYGYVIVMLLVQAITHLVMTGSGVGYFVGASASLAIWLVLLIPDNKLTPEMRTLKAETAHVADWRPLWFWIL